MSKGVISAQWYSMLTGLALLYVAYLLGSVADSDPAAPFVAVLLAIAGVWQAWAGRPATASAQVSALTRRTSR